MAGGINTPELVAAVANAGAIGSFGFAYSSPEAIDQDLSAARQLTGRLINANFFVFPEVRLPSADQCTAAVETLNSLDLVIDGDYEMPVPPFCPSLEAQLEPLWRNKPDLLTFHFGLPAPSVLDQAHDLGMLVGVTATSVDEALQIQAAGADFIVAQGFEAGGHRGTFSVTAEGDRQLPTLALLESLRDIEIPVVAAGGIMDGNHIRRCLDSGAAAVQMGTAFLCCTEAGTGKVYRQYLLTEQNRQTVFTRGFSGRWAQAIQSEFTREMADKPFLPFPLQNSLTGQLRKLAVEQENGEYQSLWAGTRFNQIREMPAAELIESLIAEMKTQ